MNSQEQAIVETLTAEVKTLVVGNRQVTLSVARQLDTFFWDPFVGYLGFVPFGRIRTNRRIRFSWGATGEPEMEIIGRNKDGSLGIMLVERSCTGECVRIQRYYREIDREDLTENAVAFSNRFYEYIESLPLIILAGLR